MIIDIQGREVQGRRHKDNYFLISQDSSMNNQKYKNSITHKHIICNNKNKSKSKLKTL